jgi:hypothetical protein
LLFASPNAYDLSGKGAALTGGRWNSKGTPLLYTCQARALCTAEVAVHLPLGRMPRDYVLVSVEIPLLCNSSIYRNLLWGFLPHFSLFVLIRKSHILRKLFN